ncbi:MAG: hypothetical protein CVU53_00605 [Deltaproteobacteria bacterium HGW-Deltaproteobacteria-11]|nr:MAG: hypothetical protein CVU53_00605 [Deltaproteobacteria bacterium HGW-Deltaproteobacteria-11]
MAVHFVIDQGMMNIRILLEAQKSKQEIVRRLMNYPAASYGVSKTARNEASFGEYDPERFNVRPGIPSILSSRPVLSSDMNGKCAPCISIRLGVKSFHHH